MIRYTARDKFAKKTENPDVSDAISLIQIAETLDEMSLKQISTRNYFAAKAMAAYIAEGTKSVQEIPKLAYNMADLMMEAGKK